MFRAHRQHLPLDSWGWNESLGPGVCKVFRVSLLWKMPPVYKRASESAKNTGILSGHSPGPVLCCFALSTRPQMLQLQEVADYAPWVLALEDPLMDDWLWYTPPILSCSQLEHLHKQHLLGICYVKTEHLRSEKTSIASYLQTRWGYPSWLCKVGKSCGQAQLPAITDTFACVVRPSKMII